MYYYIVDPQKISQRDFERVQNLLYSSLSEYRISGEVVRVTGLRTITQLVEAAFSRGVKTLVAVGNEETLNDVINAVRGREVLIGFIPIMDTEIGNILGVRDIEQGAKTIAMRRVAQMDLGVVNQSFFIGKLTFGLTVKADQGLLGYKLAQDLAKVPEINLKFSVDGNYQVEVTTTGGMIMNARENSGKNMAHPGDGMLDLVLLSKLTQWEAIKYRGLINTGQWEEIPKSSVVHMKKLEITAPEGLNLRAGERVLAKTPAVVEIAPNALKIIVGRDRKF